MSDLLFQSTILRMESIILPMLLKSSPNKQGLELLQSPTVSRALGLSVVVNRAKRKWASVWRPIATNPMSLEASTTDPMYTTELYKSVAVNEISVTGNEDSSEELKNAAPEAEVLGEVGSGTDTVEFEEDWSQKWISIENSL